MVTNEDGYIAIRYVMDSNKYISIGDPIKREYLFQARTAGVSLAWIHPDDVGQILAIQKICCGGHGSPLFHYANEMDVKIWTTGNK